MGKAEMGKSDSDCEGKGKGKGAAIERPVFWACCRKTPQRGGKSCQGHYVR